MQQSTNQCQFIMKTLVSFEALKEQHTPQQTLALQHPAPRRELRNDRIVLRIADTLGTLRNRNCGGERKEDDSVTAKMAQVRGGMERQEAGSHMRKQRVFEVFYHCASAGDVEAVDKVKL
ncbi:hypothetical protein AWZ03_009054 [Drosophila navojoa]|uniref:Uncharacterized protein n=1 Tax=Drosophila navojoa TaxID=7232 RepID=A0A484B6N6_DRONA|nr:hypothetical protein AWZ03_009054 [Drosophila navojoa]